MNKVKIRSHLRKTKKGRRTKVKQHLRKVKGGVISEKHRKIFNVIASQSIEYGGDLDFGKKKKRAGNLERFNTFVGKEDYIDLPDDYEMSWHIHPRGSYRTPSEYDMADFIKSKGNQAAIIFSRGRAISFVKTKKSMRLNRLTRRQLLRRYKDIYPKPDDRISSMKVVEQRVINQLKKDGFIVIDHKKEGDIRIPIKIIE